MTLRIVLGEQDRKSFVNMALKMSEVSLSELLKVADREVKSLKAGACTLNIHSKSLQQILAQENKNVLPQEPMLCIRALIYSLLNVIFQF